MKGNSFLSVLRHVIAAVSLTVTVACSTADKDVRQYGLSDREVNFSAELQDVCFTKGQIPLTNSNLFTMGVFAGYEEDESFGPTSPANDFINNVRYTRSFITNPFAGGDVCYWPFSGKLSFFAYAPYVSNTYLQFSSSYVSGYPVMNYSPTTNVSEQPDLCLASPVLDRHSTIEPIPLVFNHSLTQVLFSANYTGRMPDVSADLYIKVDSIRICNIIGRKNVSMSNGNPCFEWQADNTCSVDDRTSYLMDRTMNHQIRDLAVPRVTEPLSDNFLELTSVNSVANGVMYLLPQSMNYADAYLQVTYGYYEMIGATETLRASVTTRCNLPAVTWEPAHAYRYKFTINLATSSIVNPIVSVEAWSDIDNTQSDPIHIE